MVFCMELKEIIQNALDNKCVVTKDRHNYYNIICEFVHINNIVFDCNNAIVIKEIDNIIYFGTFWIQKENIKSIYFNGSGYKIL